MGHLLRTPITATLTLLVLALGCSTSDQSQMVARREIRAYPHHAAPARAKEIRERFTQVAEGMTSQEVTVILGEPDEIRPLYEPKVKSPKTIGVTHWYVIRRLRSSGSVNDKAEIAVRVSFGFDDRVRAIDSLGMADATNE